MSYDSRPDTLEHIRKVRYYIGIVRVKLQQRGIAHDQSKLSGMEKEAFDIITPKLAELEYGSEGYRTALRETKPAILEHYSKNSHHPEHFPNGINGMSLLDLIEMLCDWKAASERMKPKVEAEAGERAGETNGMLHSLDHNVERFKIDPQLASILHNTIIEMGWS